MIKYQIDHVHESEYPMVTELWEASVRATHHFLTEDDVMFFKPLVLETYLPAVKLHCIRDQDQKILGFAGTLGDKLEMLFIHPEARGMGIGKEILKYAIEVLKVSKVDVNEDNPQAVGFYEYMQFQTVGRSELDGMGNPFPILHMELKLQKTDSF